MENEKNHNYISLREAAEYTGYSQEYLNLRIRQKKLKGIKIGRNWATTKEWMNEYVERVNNYKNQRAESKAKKEREKKKPIPPTSSFTPTPTPAPFQPGPRAWFVAITLALVFVLGSVGTIFSYPYLESAIKSIRISDLTTNIFSGADLISEEFSQLGQSIAQNLSQSSQLISKGTDKAGEGISRTISQGAKSIKNFTFNLTNDLVKFIIQDISAIKKFVSNIPQRVVSIFKEKPKPAIPEQILTQEQIEKLIAEKFVTEEQLRELQEGFEKLKTEGLPQKEIIKEVQRITQITPVKEITKEILTIDDKSLRELKSQIAEIQEWEKDIQTLQTLTSKLQTHPPYTQVTTAPVYIGSQGIQIGGAAILASLGVSGSAGITNLGVGGSTSLGSDSSDKLTVNATADFISPVTISNTLETTGNITTQGNISVAGDLTVSGTQTYSGTASFTASSTQPALSVNQTGSGNIVEFKDATTTVFTIAVGGYVGIGTSTPQAPLHIESTTGPQLRVGYDATNYFELNVTAQGSIQFRPSIETAHFQFQTKGGSSTVLDIDTDSKLVGIGTTTPARKLDVSGLTRIWDQSGGGYTILEVRAGDSQSTFPLVEWQDATGNTLGVISNQGYFGFGTTTPPTPLYVIGTSTFVGNLDISGTLSIGNTTLSDGTLDLGTGSDDDLTASDITDLTDSGATTLHKHGGNKTDFIAPEYESGILQADGSDNTGTMISDSETVSNVVYNYYKWTSTQAAKQDYDIVIHLRVPDTFSSWQTNAITLYYKTGLTGTTNNAVSWTIYEDGNATPLMSSGEMASSVADTWTSDSATSAELSALTAGDVYRVVIKLAANSTASAAAYAGKISINYLWYSN